MDVGGLVKWVWICEVSEEGFVFVCGDARGEVTTSRESLWTLWRFPEGVFLEELGVWFGSRVSMVCVLS